MSGEPGFRSRFGKSFGSDVSRRLGGAPVTPGQPFAPASEEAETGRESQRWDYLSVKASLLERLLDELGRRNLFGLKESEISAVISEFAERTLATEAVPLNVEERRRLAEELTDEAMGLGPLAPLLADPAVTDILVNSVDKVFVERFGRIERSPVRFRDNEQILRIIERIAAGVGRHIDSATPMVDLRLPDGSRVNATLPPVTLDGPTISIRRFGRRRLRQSDLIELGMMTEGMRRFLAFAIAQRANILISGGTGAGKSTLLGALAESIPAHERIITIEDTAELRMDQEHVVRMETRNANIEGRGRIEIKDLVINSLRMRPDRIIVGEVRSEEALSMLQAMNTGHDGSMTTIHANSPRDALSRLETMVLMGGVELPSRAIREQITSAIQILVHVRRGEDGIRRVENIAEITGMESSIPTMHDVFIFRRKGRQGKQLIGEFAPTGIVPRLVQNLRNEGHDFPLQIFQRTPGAE